MSLFLSNFLQATYFKTDLWANGMYENLSSSGWWILPQLGLLYAYTFNYPFYGYGKVSCHHGNYGASRATFSCLAARGNCRSAFLSYIHTPVELVMNFHVRKTTVIYCCLIRHVLVQTYHCFIVSIVCELVYVCCLPKPGESIFGPPRLRTILWYTCRACLCISISYCWSICL